MNRVLRHMAESFPKEFAEEPSCLKRGRISPAVVEKLFGAAEVLFLAAPWKKAGDTQVLRLDIPRLGVQGACISIIGALGESVGFLIFPSYVPFARITAPYEAGVQ